jgi:radical SAM superfamily enzyme YgiQ (UPF0313 family)
LIPVYSLFPDLPELAHWGEARPYPPLALGAVISFAKKYRGGALQKRYRFLRRTFLDVRELELGYSERGTGVFLFSNYMWSLARNLDVAKTVKQWDPGNLTVFGGPSIPKGKGESVGFLSSHPQVDICVRGEGEVTLAELLDRLASRDLLGEDNFRAMNGLNGVTGVTFRRRERESEDLVFTGQRERSSDLSDFPSPYTSGDFDENHVSEWFYATLETNRGCPYRCSFCDWGGATGLKIHNFRLARVIGEIDWLARHEIPRIYVIDANFGILERDVEIVRAIANAKSRHGFPKQVTASYCKTSPQRCVEMVRTLTDAGIAAIGTVGLQSTDPTVLRCTARGDVNLEVFAEWVELFRRERLALAADLMMGLPGATVDSLKGDLQFCFDRRLGVAVYPSFAIPNTLLVDDAYVAEHRIETGSDGRIESTFTFDRRDRAEMETIALAYELYEKYGLLRYVLWYLQFDHGIYAMDVVQSLSELLADPPKGYAAIGSVSQRFQNGGRDAGFSAVPVPSGGWSLFYEEVLDYLLARYDISIDSGLETAFDVQRAVMPEIGRDLPETADVRHDFPNYYLECLGGYPTSRRRKLVEFGPAQLTVSDPYRICENLRRNRVNGEGHFVHWVLDTVMSSTKTVMFDKECFVRER